MPMALPIARLLASPRRSEATSSPCATAFVATVANAPNPADQPTGAPPGVNLAGISRILELEDDNAALLAENRASTEQAPRKPKPS